MNIVSYLEGLMPQLTRSQMRDDLARIRQELEECTLPLYATATEIFGKHKFQSRFNVEFEKMFDRQIKLNHKGNFYSGVNDGLLVLNENLDILDRLVDKSETSFSRQAISVLNVNLTQIIETYGFISRYSRRLLNASIQMESNLMDGEGEFHDLAAGDHKWLDQNKNTFLDAFELMTIKKADLERKMKDIPDITVSAENLQAVTASAGLDKVDPLKLGLIPASINIFYKVGLWVAELQAARYKSAVAERDSIQLRLMYLQQQSEKKADPIVKEEIIVAQSRVDKLNYKIKDMEEEWISH